MAFWTQLLLLLWNNFLYRRRQPMQLLVELMWPIFLFFILVAVRHSHPPLEQHECEKPTSGVPAGHFPNKPLPSAGTVPWLQGLICNVNNTCFPRPTPAEEPGVLSNFRTPWSPGSWQMPPLFWGGPRAHRMLASLRQLMPTLRAARGAGAAWRRLSDQPKEGPSLATELLRTLLQGESLVFVLGQAQESLDSLVEAAKDLAQEVRGPCSLYPNQETGRVGCLEGEVTGQPQAPILTPGAAGLVELWVLLWRLQGPGGPLEAVAEALCSARGPSKPGGPSLTWYEASDLKELVGQEPVRALPHHSLISTRTELMGALDAHPLSRRLWGRLKPLVLGKVVFSSRPRGSCRSKEDGSQELQARTWGRQALRAFLNPRSGGCSWQEAHADGGHLVGTLGRVMECVTLDKLEAAPSEAALVERALELLSEHRFWAGIVLLEPEDFPDSSQSPCPGHARIKIAFWDPGPAADPLMDLRYVWGGFMYLQDLLERAAMRVLTGAAPRAGLYLQQMPYLCYVNDAFLTMTWIYSVALTVKAVVREKETRLRCTMHAMGLSGALGDILPYSHAVVLFLFLAAFKVATVVQSFLLSAFFSRANLVAACEGLAYFVLYLPYVLCVAWLDQLPVGGRVAASLLLPVAFGFGCESLELLEEQGEGAQWHNVSGLLLLDAALYGLATRYLAAVCPGGPRVREIPEPWNFTFRRSYWFGPQTPKGPAPPPAPQDPKVLVEEAPPGLIPGVSIRSLEKRFPGNPQPALHGLSLDFYQGLITAFLGHNGAGKTTMLSILSGLFPPTAGSACVLGHDVRSNMAAIQPHLGVCPQYSVLFDMLTMDEHVWFYEWLKGLSAAAVGPEQDRGMQQKLSVAIAFVGGSQVIILDEPTAGVDPASRRDIRELLLKYHDDRTLILSTCHLDEAELSGDHVAVVAGGRLCCCGSPLFLQRHLGSRYYLTLVKGPPAPATSKKGDTDLKDNMNPGQEREPGSQASTAGVAQLLALVQSHVPGARLVKELPHELVLALPYQGALDGSFPELFRKLDQRLGELGLAGFGISDTSLEEVWLLGEIFLKVVEDCAVDTGPEGAAADGRPRRHPCSGVAHLDATARLQIPPEESALENGGPVGSAPETQALQGSGPDAAGHVQGWALTHQQLRALLLKRFLLARCSHRGLFAQIVLPALFVGLALVFSLIMPPFRYYPALQLSPSMYGAQVSFFSEDAPGHPERARLLEALLEEAGLEETYLKNNSNRAPECTQPAVCQFSVPEVPVDVAKVLANGNWTLESPSPACQCSQPGAHSLLPDCPAAAGGPPPPQAPTSSGEVVQNLTGRNLSDFLVKTYPRLVRQGLKTKKWVNEVRYGGFSLGGRDPGLPSGLEVGRSVEELWALLSPQLGGALDRILNNFTAWALGLDTQKGLKLGTGSGGLALLGIWFNNKGWHAMVAFVNRANNALLRARLLPSPAHHAHSITTLNHPPEPHQGAAV
ncbi:phospholipid-transporting ATPase ABCA7 [Balaenoptera acutorostrata]|uniref:Phospholipid-transporting ATPase ABCA7 n=1 Tax=Balaenoptera acutorostrata TaxID=9767 RepID=A0ABM3T2Y9_BALAC|nr:phospholipid-transporting ATPase ABCA7 [Balaenoptera acutorostrata]